MKSFFRRETGAFHHVQCVATAVAFSYGDASRLVPLLMVFGFGGDRGDNNFWLCFEIVIHNLFSVRLGDKRGRRKRAL